MVNVVAIKTFLYFLRQSMLSKQKEYDTQSHNRLSVYRSHDSLTQLELEFVKF